MQGKTLLQFTLAFSLLLHLLLLFSFTFIWFHPVEFEKDKSPSLFIPSYISSPPPQSIQTPVEQNKKNSELGIQKSASKKTPPNFFPAQPSLMSPAIKKEDPVHLIGDENMEDPLRKLLGQALTRHLIYPEIARELRLGGVVTLEFILYPDGHITEIHLLKSSGESLLDNASLEGVQEMSPVPNVDLYVKKARNLVINIIFQ